MDKIKTVAYLRYGCADGESTKELVRRDTGFYTEICAEKGMELVDVYYDHASAHVKDRLGLKKLLDDSSTGKFQRVIVKSISKLSRDTMEALNLVRQLKENGVSVWLEMEGGLLEGEMLKMFTVYAGQNKEPQSIQLSDREDETDEMLAYLDKLNHDIKIGDEKVYDTEVEIRVGEKSVKLPLDEEVFGVIYDIILSMRGEI